MHGLGLHKAYFAWQCCSDRMLWLVWLMDCSFGGNLQAMLPCGCGRIGQGCTQVLKVHLQVHAISFTSSSPRVFAHPVSDSKVHGASKLHGAASGYVRFIAAVYWHGHTVILLGHRRVLGEHKFVAGVLSGHSFPTTHSGHTPAPMRGHLRGIRCVLAASQCLGCPRLSGLWRVAWPKVS